MMSRLIASLFFTDYEFLIEGDRGRVIVQHLSYNGTICADNWNDVAAEVLCRSKGYMSGIAYNHFRPDFATGRSKMCHIPL